MRSASKKKNHAYVGSSSSYHEPSRTPSSQGDRQYHKSKDQTSANKKMESASLDLSDTSNKKYW